MKQIFDFRRPRASADNILDFLDGKSGPNDGIMTVEEFRDAFTEYANSDSAPCPYLYQPALIEAAVDSDALCAVAGQPARAKSRPADWDSNVLGEWKEGDRLQPGRMHHAKDISKLVVNPEDIVEIPGIGRAVMGIYAINQSKTGNYGTIIDEARRLSFADMPDVESLVGLINNETVIENLEDGGWIVWKPNQQVTWGYLERGGVRLSHENIRSDNTNCIFAPLANPIVGRDIGKDELIGAVRDSMSKVVNDKGQNDWDKFCGRKGRNQNAGAEKTWNNVGTLCRNHPRSIFPFGFRGVQIAMPCFTRYIGDAIETAQECLNFVIGARLPVAYSENQWNMRDRLAVDDMPEVEETKVEVSA